MIDLRHATLNDADTLFAWRNDPVTLACFKSTAPVPREDHDNWMKFNVVMGYPEHIVLMADTEHGSVGVVRFDARRNDVLTYDASITIAPQARGMGLALGVLSEACRYMHEYTINADIRRTNYRSRKIFAQCGFDLVDAKDEFVQYRREPL